MLDRLIEQSRDFDSRKTDVGPIVPSGSCSFEKNDDHRLCMNVTAGAGFGDARMLLGLTDNAATQVCAKLGSAAWPQKNKTLPRDYLFDACSPEMAADHLNHWVRTLGVRHPYRRWFVRAYDDMCRAVLSGRYAVVDITETLTWVKEALDSKNRGGSVTVWHPIVTPDVLHLKILFQDFETDGGSYAVGGYITTGETGNRRLGVYPLVQRHSCTNSIVIEESEFAWNHTHVGRKGVLRYKFLVALYDVLKGSAGSLQRLLDAREQEIPDFAEYIEKLAKRYGWTTMIKDSVLLGTEGQSTKFGVVNGVSFAAQRMEDHEERVAMEALAGELLVGR